MKKITILAAVVALLGSCAQNTEDTINPNTKVEGRTIYATFDNEEEETKTYVENYKYLRWHAGDEISFFDATTHNSQYAFAGNDGDAEGEFNAVATGEGTAIATTYGVYPYNANTSISEEGIISVTLPAIQAYGVNSFGKGANTMVAVGESATDDKLFFKNACGYLVVKLYNENGAAVKSVVLEGNNDEKIAGATTITATHAGVPSVTMADTATTSVTIDCGEGVEIGTTVETATEFWFALPETTFEGGITITATDTEGKEYEKTTTKPVVITRNNVQPMKALGAFFMPHIIPETWRIYYTATTKIEKQSWSNTSFGANIVSNEWDSATGKGVITFDGVVTKIGSSAFNTCRSLTSITIPDSVTSIGSYAFYGCSNLVSATIPESVTIIEFCTFEGCTSLKRATIGNGVTWIREAAFCNCSSLTSITIPKTVRTIDSYAFRGCTGTLTINSKVIEANYGPTNSPAYNPDDTDADIEAWLYKANFTHIIIGNNITKIGDYVFSGCSSIEDVSIPEGVVSIGDATFEGCSKLANITIPNSVGTIGNSAFEGCSSLTSVTLSSGISSISSRMFYGCSNLQDITIPDGVTSIRSYAFYGCTSMLSLTMGKGITTIDKQAFNGCGKDVGAHLYVNCTTTFNEQAGDIATNGNNWLYGSNFVFVTIGDDVKSIGSYAFYGYPNITVVTIGSNVSTINRRAFWGCANLNTVLCKPSTPPNIYYYALTPEGSFPFNNNLSIGVSADAYEFYTLFSGYSSGSVTMPNWSVYESYLWKTSF